MREHARAVRMLALRIVSDAALLLLAPVLIVQGRRVRRITPRLPGAAGPAEGEVTGAEPRVRLLVLGESTAAGVGARSHDDALAGQLAAALARGTGRRIEWRVRGANGATARDVRADLLAQPAGASVDLIVIALGVNDTLRRASPARWRADLAQLADVIRARAPGAVMLFAAVPPMHRFPALPAPLRQVLGLRARLLDRVLGKWARETADVTHVAHPTVVRADEVAMFCEDGFHPSAGGYALWAAALAGAAAEVLSMGIEGTT